VARQLTEEQRESKRAADKAHYAATKEQRKAYRMANREKRKAQSRAWYKKNREHALEYAKTYYTENREDIRQREKAAYDADPEKYRAYARQWREKYPEKVREASLNRDPVKNRAAVKRWQQANPEKVRIIRLRNAPKRNAQKRTKRQLFPELVHAKDQAWRAKNREHLQAYQANYIQLKPEVRLWIQRRYRRRHPEKVITQIQRRRARKLAVPINDLTAEQWQEVLQVFHYRCAYCPPTCKECKNKTHALTQDHIVPLSKNGSNTVSNIAPACQSCNSKKGTKGPLVPVQPLLFTLT
jgi:5-methylcytosine-specific restriction endonuclease McrA